MLRVWMPVDACCKKRRAVSCCFWSFWFSVDAHTFQRIVSSTSMYIISRPRHLLKTSRRYQASHESSWNHNCGFGPVPKIFYNLTTITFPAVKQWCNCDMQVAWGELCEAGLVELMTRLLVPSFSEDCVGWSVFRFLSRTSRFLLFLQG